MATDLSTTCYQVVSYKDGLPQPTVLATCADDIVFAPPDQPAITGHDACRAFLEEFPTPSTFTAEFDDVDGQGNLAFSRGNAAATFEDGTATTFKWLAIHRRQADGSWKMTRDTWNTNEPAAQ